MRRIVKRRTFLVLTGLAGAGGIGLYFDVGESTLRFTKCYYLPGAYAVGEKYLSMYENERNIEALRKYIFSDKRVSSIEEIRVLLSSRIKDDFEQNHIVMIDGWILSETEVKLFALATLTDHVNL